MSRKRLLLFIVVDTIIIKCIIACRRRLSLEMWIATFRLLTASLHQAIRSTIYAAPFLPRRSAVIGAFRSSIVPLFRRVVATSAVRCCTVLLLLCFLIVGIHAFRNFNSETAKVWVGGSRISLSCSLILSCIDLPVSPI